MYRKYSCHYHTTRLAPVNTLWEKSSFLSKSKYSNKFLRYQWEITTNTIAYLQLVYYILYIIYYNMTMERQFTNISITNKYLYNISINVLLPIFNCQLRVFWYLEKLSLSNKLIIYNTVLSALRVNIPIFLLI